MIYPYTSLFCMSPRNF